MDFHGKSLTMGNCLKESGGFAVLHNYVGYTYNYQISKFFLLNFQTARVVSLLNQLSCVKVITQFCNHVHFLSVF